VAAEPQAAGQIVSSPPQVVPALPVPRLIKFSGVAKDGSGQPHHGVVGITFSIYADQQGAATLWMETQNIELDAHGRYAVLLGSTQSAGLPLDLFATGEPRWLGAKLELPGEVEQARVLLVSVPYALKASDADTVGGMPASAFVLAPTGSSAGAEASAPGSTKSKAAGSGAHPQFTSSGTANYIPIFTDNSGDLGNSNIYQSAPGNYAIKAPTGGNALNASNFVDQDMIVALTAPGASDKHAYFGPGTNTNLTLGVGGAEMMRITSAGNVGIGYSNPQQRFVIGAPAGGKVLNVSNLSDQDLNVVLTAPGASNKYTYVGPSVATNLTLGVGLAEMMRITSSGNVGIGTTAPAATLEVNGTGRFDGLVSFAGGQTFPGTATLGTNTFTGNQTVNGNLSATGLVTGAAFNIGSNLFAFGSYTNENAFLGFAGNSKTTGIFNTSTGYLALASNTTGNQNTASGGRALSSNTTGDANTASGTLALASNTTGNQNTASGNGALYSNTTGSQNTANGDAALSSNATGSANTATGYEALYSNTVAEYNTADGYQALYSNVGDSAQDGWYNTAVGYQALYNNNDTDNSGMLAQFNTAVGVNALYSNTTGSYNTAVGAGALGPNTQGWENTAAGVYALQNNTTGNYNTAFGFDAFPWNYTGSFLTCIGYGCNVTVDGLSNATAIGAYAAVGASNSLLLGCVYGVNEGCPSNVKVGIGTTTPDNNLTVNGTADKPGGGSWGTYSDRRLKTVDGGFNSGLSQILKLHPVRYRYNKENALGIQDSQEHVGLVAQDVQAVIPEAVTENSKGYLLLNNDPILWSMLNAIKEQQALIQKQQALIARLTQRVKTIQTTLKENGRNSSAVRTVKTEGTTVRQ